jgi:hypothetical protein
VKANESEQTDGPNHHPFGTSVMSPADPLRGQEPRQKQVVIGHRGRSIMKILLLCPLLFVALQSCATREIQKSEPAFDPSISTRELDYIIGAFDSFVNDGKPCDSTSSKALVLQNGGIRDRELAVVLPDKSTLRLKIDSDKRIYLSGYPLASERYLKIEILNDKYYGLSDCPRQGIGAYACFKISRRGGWVENEPILLACP